MHHYYPLLFASFLGLFVPMAAPMAAYGSSFTGTASVTIIRPLQVQPLKELSFGRLLPNASGGQVRISATNERFVEGADLSIRGKYSPATFVISGSPDVAYNIVTPSFLEFSSSKFPNKTALRVTDFTTLSRTSKETHNNGTLNSNGKDRLYIGGTLIVSPLAAPGRYKGIVPITVTYQ